MQAEVTNLHLAASKRTEKLLRRIGSTCAKASPGTESKPVERQAVVLFDFERHLGGDLQCRKGDVITIVGNIESTWWTATSAGKKGIVPANYVRIVEDDIPSQAGTQTQSSTAEETENPSSQCESGPSDSDPGVSGENPLPHGSEDKEPRSRTFNKWKAKFDSWRQEIKIPRASA